MKKILLGLMAFVFSSMAFAQESCDTNSSIKKFFTVKVSHDEKEIIREHFIQTVDNEYKDEITFDPSGSYLVLKTDNSGNRIWEKSAIPGLSIKLKKIDGQFEIKTYQVNRINDTEYVQLGEMKVLNFNEKYLLPTKYNEKEVFVEIKEIKEIIFN